jgi:thiosulfate dehydrogenase (quinone) large subunit
MMFLFAYLGKFGDPKGWPVGLIHTTEICFIASAIVCVCLLYYCNKMKLVNPLFRVVVAYSGGILCAFALVMPMEMAPFFFNVGGEVMLGTFVLAPIGYIVFSALFSLLLLEMAR